MPPFHAYASDSPSLFALRSRYDGEEDYASWIKVAKKLVTLEPLRVHPHYAGKVGSCTLRAWKE